MVSLEVFNLFGEPLKSDRAVTLLAGEACRAGFASFAVCVDGSESGGKP
ncbi:MAG: hypothetical protein WAM69_03420 [Candidatus Sulfotelmatobacter sp.]